MERISISVPDEMLNRINRRVAQINFVESKDITRSEYIRNQLADDLEQAECGE
jgi:metal-responsive CopG/Arc/MetJ family transcriptional regulator